MGRGEKTKFDDDEEETKTESKSLAEFSSTDDEEDLEANEDLSLKIVEKALLMGGTRFGTHQNSAVGFIATENSMHDGSAVVRRSNGNGAVASSSSPETAAAVKKEQTNNKVIFADEVEKTGAVEDPSLVESADPNNTILRQLLRGPRYFDPPGSGWSTCYNCGGEGHMAVNCTEAKKKKPCYVCGSLDHGHRQCDKGKDCYICRTAGHQAKNCPEKYNGVSRICLKCGDYGHDMFSCRNSYSADDLQATQCYSCKGFGHLCCVKNVVDGERVVSCYRCGATGHNGMGCSMLSDEAVGTASTYTASTSTCYRCGEGGHFARECTTPSKSLKRMRDISALGLNTTKKGKKISGQKSAPPDIGKARKKRKTRSELKTPPSTPPSYKSRKLQSASSSHHSPSPRFQKPSGYHSRSSRQLSPTVGFQRSSGYQSPAPRLHRTYQTRSPYEGSPPTAYHHQNRGVSGNSGRGYENNHSGYDQRYRRNNDRRW